VALGSGDHGGMGPEWAGGAGHADAHPRVPLFDIAFVGAVLVVTRKVHGARVAGRHARLVEAVSVVILIAVLEGPGGGRGR